jgi:hypothetical protein
LLGVKLVVPGLLIILPELLVTPVGLVVVVELVVMVAPALLLTVTPAPQVQQAFVTTPICGLAGMSVTF